MRPPQRDRTDYERLRVDEWISGVIQDIQYEAEHKREWKGEIKIGPAVRFKFAFEGYQYPHYSRWMTFNTGSKANLYIKYIASLVAGAEPNIDFDLDVLKGMKIKTMWSDNGDFQNIEMIRPVGAKVAVESAPMPARSAPPGPSPKHADYPRPPAPGEPEEDYLAPVGQEDD